jgi:hypothetical protein
MGAVLIRQYSGRIYHMVTTSYPIILEGYISNEDATRYVDLLSPLVKDNENRSHIKTALGYENSMAASQVGISRDIINDYSEADTETVKAVGALFVRIRKELEQNFGVPMDAVNISYQEMYPGASNPMHSDSTTLDGAPLREDGMPEELEWSALLYLNSSDEDFTGGKIGFTKQDLVLSPKVGDLIFFPGNHHYPHYVSEVESGIRRNFVLFFGRKGNTSDTMFFEKG